MQCIPGRLFSPAAWNRGYTIGSSDNENGAVKLCSLENTSKLYKIRNRLYSMKHCKRTMHKYCTLEHVCSVSANYRSKGKFPFVQF